MNKFSNFSILLAICVTFGAENVHGKSQSKQEERKADWWQSANFYQIYPRSFKDSNDDGIGDIRGIISKLDYLKELGVTATWLSPVLKGPQVDYGYDISDFTQVDEIFGTNEDLEELFEKAHELGIKVIMDFVPNHTSNQHEWFLKSVARVKGFENFYMWHDGYPVLNGRPMMPNNWVSVFNIRAWTWNDERQQYYLHQFTREQPDLNYKEQRVVDAMKNVLRFWLDKGADGFRIDAVNHLFEDPAMRDEPLTGLTTNANNYTYLEHIHTKDLTETLNMVAEWRRLIDDYNREKGGDTRVIFTEAYAGLDATMRYYGESEDEPRSHFPFNFILIQNLNSSSTAGDFKATIDSWLSKVPLGGTSNWVLGNHDRARFASRYGRSRIDGLLTLLMTLPGVAVTYNGDEIGMEDYRDISWEDTLDPPACNLGRDDYKLESRDPVRTPFQWDGTANAGFMNDVPGVKPWIQVHPNYMNVNLQLQRDHPKSYFKYYQQLSLLRQNNTFVFGDFKSTAVTNDVFGFVRSLDGDATYVILINFSDNEITLDINSLGVDFNEQSVIVVAGSTSEYDAGTVVSTLEFKLRAYESVVLENTSSAGVIKVSLFIFIAAALRNFL